MCAISQQILHQCFSSAVSEFCPSGSPAGPLGSESSAPLVPMRRNAVVFKVCNAFDKTRMRRGKKGFSFIRRFIWGFLGDFIADGSTLHFFFEWPPECPHISESLMGYLALHTELHLHYVDFFLQFYLPSNCGIFLFTSELHNYSRWNQDLDSYFEEISFLGVEVLIPCWGIVIFSDSKITMKIKITLCSNIVLPK